MPYPAPYVPDPARYDGRMPYRRTGRSGLRLPAISLGLWQNFGGADVFEAGRAILRRAFDRGVTHFDLANNYGPPYGSAEENFGRVLATDFAGHRDELIVSTHPEATSGWLRRKNLLAEIRKLAGDRPVTHVVSDVAHRTGARNVLVIANETVLGAPLLDDKRDVAFDVARRVAQLRPEHFLRYLLPLPRELSHLIDAAIALADEAAGKAPVGELAKTTDALKRQLPTPALDQVVTLGHRFRARALDPMLPVMRAHGVPGLIAHLDGAMDLEDAIARGQADTRAYAKRQVTWFRHQMGTGWRWLDPEAAAEL